MNRLLKTKTDEQLLRMPLATDQEKIACMQLLHLIFLDASFSNPIYCPLIAGKLMRLTLKYGFSAFTAAAFICFGVTILPRDASSGQRYGALSLKFLDRFASKEFIPRVSCLFYKVLASWTVPLSECDQPLLESYRIGLLREMSARQQHHTVLGLLLIAQSLHRYMGLSDDPLSPQGDLLDHDEATKRMP